MCTHDEMNICIRKNPEAIGTVGTTAHQHCANPVRIKSFEARKANKIINSLFPARAGELMFGLVGSVQLPGYEWFNCEIKKILQCTFMCFITRTTGGSTWWNERKTIIPFALSPRTKKYGHRTTMVPRTKPERRITTTQPRGVEPFKNPGFSGLFNAASCSGVHPDPTPEKKGNHRTVETETH